MFSRKFGKLILTLTITIMLISACGGADVSPTPTEVSLDAIYTAAAATVFAGQTGTAGAQPTKTLTPTATVSPTPTVTGTPSPTRGVIVPAPVIVAVNTITGTPWTLTPSSGAVGGNNSAIVQDGAVPNMKAGESFTKTWIIKNTGTTTWSPGYKITFIGGNTLGRDNSTKIFKTVSPGGTYTQNLGFTAPNAPGTYTGSWQLSTDKGTLFGAIFKVIVVVPGATNTPTSAVSATPSKTAVPTGTPTPTNPAYPNP